jgi:hypothetical protein
VPSGASRAINLNSWRLPVTDHRSDPSSDPFYLRARRSLFSARKIALMASVVAGLGIAGVGFESLPGGFGKEIEEESQLP